MTDVTQPNLASSMQDLLNKVHLDREKEALKQDKATTTQINVQTELYEEASKLSGQTEAVQNVREVVDILRDLTTLLGSEHSQVKQVAQLLTSSIKRARASYK